MPGISVFYFIFGVSINALYRVSFRVGYIITTIIIALVFVQWLFLGIVLFYFYGCMGVGFDFSFIVWVSMFSCTTVGWKDFLCLCCCLNRCCWGQVALGSRRNAQEGPAGTP